MSIRTGLLVYFLKKPVQVTMIRTRRGDLCSITTNVCARLLFIKDPVLFVGVVIRLNYSRRVLVQLQCTYIETEFFCVHTLDYSTAKCVKLSKILLALYKCFLFNFPEEVILVTKSLIFRSIFLIFEIFLFLRFS